MATMRWRWWPLHPYADWRMAQRGARDGAARPPIPPWNAPEPSPAINELANAGDHDIHLVAQRWMGHDGRARARWEQAEIRLAAALEHRQTTEQEHLEAVRAYRELHGQIPPDTGWVRSLGYALAMFVLFVFELPLNAVVFRIFHENELMTMLFTGGISIVLLFCAHELGKLLREEAWGYPTTRAFIYGLVALPVLVIVGVAYTRQVYLQMLPVPVFRTHGWIFYLAFAAINLAIFAVATAVAYRHYQEGLGAVARARAAHGRAIRAHVRAWLAVKAARARRQRAYQTAQALYYRISDEVQRLKRLYENENLYHRGDRQDEHETGFPRSFYQDALLATPEVFAGDGLDWTMDGAPSPAAPVAPEPQRKLWPA